MDMRPYVTIRQETTGLRIYLYEPWHSPFGHVNSATFRETDITDAVEGFIRQAVKKAMAEQSAEIKPD